MLKILSEGNAHNFGLILISYKQNVFDPADRHIIQCISRNLSTLCTAAHPIADYKEARHLEVIHNEQIIGNQPGDPENAALAFIKVAEMQERPLHLFLGSDSFGMAHGKIEAVQKDLAAFESISRSTDFQK